MKTKMIQTTLRTGLLCALILILVNCKKDSTVITPTPSLNYSTFTDSRDGKTYKYIKIGSLNWMAENLAYKTVSESWFSWDSEAENAKYGRLYTWEAAKLAVPTGWHLPTDEEWKQLGMSLGMSQSEADKVDIQGTNEGEKMKSIVGWGDNGNGTDEVGFSALPGGMRTNSGSYFVNGWYGYWWSATVGENSRIWVRHLTFYNSEVYRSLSFKEDGYSVRCVKD